MNTWPNRLSCFVLLKTRLVYVKDREGCITTFIPLVNVLSHHAGWLVPA
jgi:hypothetical protein